MAKMLLIDDNGNNHEVAICGLDTKQEIKDYMYQCKTCNKLMLLTHACACIHQEVVHEAWISFFVEPNGKIAITGTEMYPTLHMTQAEALRRHNTKDRAVPLPVKIQWVEVK